MSFLRYTAILLIVAPIIFCIKHPDTDIMWFAVAQSIGALILSQGKGDQ